MSADFGTTLQLLTGFSPGFPLATGPRLVLESTYRRWTTDPQIEAGRRIYGSECADIRQLLGSRFDATTRDRWQRRLAELAKIDERCADCLVTLVGSKPDKTMTLTGRIITAAGPFVMLVPFDTFTPSLFVQNV